VCRRIAGRTGAGAPCGRRTLVESLKDGARATGAPSQQRLRRTLVTAEIALSMLLLVTAGLLVQTVVRLGRVELGFHVNDVYVFDRVETARRTPPPGIAAFYEALLRRIRDTPGVAAAGAAIGVPLDAKGRFFIDDTAFTIDGEPRSATDPPTARIQVVGDGYFDALAIPLVAAARSATVTGATPCPWRSSTVRSRNATFRTATPSAGRSRISCRLFRASRRGA